MGGAGSTDLVSDLEPPEIQPQLLALIMHFEDGRGRSGASLLLSTRRGCGHQLGLCRQGCVHVPYPPQSSSPSGGPCYVTQANLSAVPSPQPIPFLPRVWGSCLPRLSLPKCQYWVFIMNAASLPNSSPNHVWSER